MNRPRRIISKPVVYLGELDDQPSEPLMKFRLTYEGELRPTQGEARENQRNPLAQHKHKIRRCFHKQLKQLWETDRFLRDCPVDGRDWPPCPPGRVSLADAIASQHHKFGHRFVPLAVERFSLLCSLDILFLRRDVPGNALHAGDIDNRIKTLIDALRCPKDQHELIENGGAVIPGPDEDPFYCLLQDDKLVNRFAVETDTLLDPPTGNNEVDNREARIVITIEVRPWYVTMDNLSYL